MGKVFDSGFFKPGMSYEQGEPTSSSEAKEEKYRFDEDD